MKIQGVLRVVGLLGVLFLAGSCTSPPVSPQDLMVGDPMRFDQQRYPDRDSLTQEKEAKEDMRKQDMLKK
jgi:hypothetical protein